jgi:hypothetical protein
MNRTVGPSAQDTRKCGVDGCDRPQVARGYCPKHYVRLLRHGDPLIVKKGTRPRSPEDRDLRCCKVADCGSPYFAKGFCHYHYNRNRKYGDPIVPKMKPRFQAARFLQEVVVDPPDTCVDWPFSTDAGGHGQVGFRGSVMRAHRAALILYSGEPAPEGFWAKHTCGRKICCNPKHVRWVLPGQA